MLFTLVMTFDIDYSDQTNFNSLNINIHPLIGEIVECKLQIFTPYDLHILHMLTLVWGKS